MPSIVQNKCWFHPGSIGVSGFRQSCGFCISTFWVSATSPHRALMPKTRIKIQNLFSDLAHEVWRKATTLASSCPYSAPLRPASNRFRRRPSPIATKPFQPPTALPPEFFCRPAQEVAPELIGCLLLKRQVGGELLGGVILETEAYCQSEHACHGHRRRNPNSSVLLPPGP